MSIASTKRQRDAQERIYAAVKKAANFNLQNFVDRVNEAVNLLDAGDISEQTWDTIEAKLSILMGEIDESADSALSCLHALSSGIVSKITPHNAILFSQEIIPMLMVLWVKTLEYAVLCGDERDECAVHVQSYHTALCAAGIQEFERVLEVLGEKPNPDDKATAEAARAAWVREAELDEEDDEFSDSSDEAATDSAADNFSSSDEADEDHIGTTFTTTIRPSDPLADDDDDDNEVIHRVSVVACKLYNICRNCDQNAGFRHHPKQKDEKVF